MPLKAYKITTSEAELLNLRELYGSKYRLSWDITVKAYPGLKSDSDYLVIPCRGGAIYALSASRLGFYCNRRGLIARMRVLAKKVPQIGFHQVGDKEVVFSFSPEEFHLVAEIARPYRKRAVSAGAANHLKKYHFQKKEANATESLQNSHLEP
jgi:hypothetical protein